MSIIGTRTRSRVFAAGLLALVCVSPGALAAQNDAQNTAEEAAAAAAIAHADSVRAALVQPEGRKWSPVAALVRAPFRVLAGTLAVVGGAGYAAYGFLNHIGAIDMVKDANRSFEAADMEVGPDFIGNRSGLALHARWNGSGTPLFVEGAASPRGYRLARGGLAFGDTLTGAELAAGYHKLTQIHFWGLGPDAVVEDRSDFGYTRRELAGSGWIGLMPHVRVGILGGWEEDEGLRGNDPSRPDVQDQFVEALPFGALGTDRFAHVGGSIDLDFTAIGRSDRLRGVRALGSWTGYRGLSDTDSEFQIGTGDLRLYLPVVTRHELALRGLAIETFGEEGFGVPLYHMPRLGSSEGLRGVRGWRYRDRSVVSAMAEWRYQVWWHPGDPQYRVDAFVFADHGAVGSSLGSIGRDDFITTPGIGLRFLDRGDAKVETYLAFGGDDTRVSLKLKASF
jgi:hypothetical protein